MEALPVGPKIGFLLCANGKFVPVKPMVTLTTNS